MAIFCFIGASPMEFISLTPKSKSTFLYSKLLKKKGGKEKGGGVGRHKKSTCFESKKLPKTF